MAIYSDRKCRLLLHQKCSHKHLHAKYKDSPEYNSCFRQRPCGIIANSGFIVDAILQVEDPTGITKVESETHQNIYTIDGRKLRTIKNQAPGVYIVGKEKVIVR